MIRIRKWSVALGVAASALAILGIVTTVVVPAVADPKPCDSDQGLMTSNLGI